MKKNLFNGDYLTPLTDSEMIDIHGGGLLYDFFYDTLHAVGSALRKVQESLTPVNDAATNPAKLSSGNYYGR